MKCPKCKSRNVSKLNKIYQTYGDYQCEDCLWPFKEVKKKAGMIPYYKAGLKYGEEI